MLTNSRPKTRQFKRALGVLLSLALAAQLAAAPLAPARPASPQGAASGETLIPDGTSLVLELTQDLSSKTAREGDPVNLKVTEDLVVNGRVVVAKGTLAKGTIAHAEKSGRMGKGGQLSLRVESTTAVDGQKLRLRATQGREGDDKTGSVIALSMLVSPLFFLKKGKQAEIKAGTRVNAFTDEEKRVRTKGEAL
jgi:hypothetical protein